jgi:hypothetical protein
MAETDIDTEQVRALGAKTSNSTPEVRVRWTGIVLDDAETVQTISCESVGHPQVGLALYFGDKKYVCTNFFGASEHDLVQYNHRVDWYAELVEVP